MTSPLCLRGRLALCLLACLVGLLPTAAHELRPAYLEVREVGDGAYEVLWNVPASGVMPPWSLEVVLPEGTQVEKRGSELVDGARVERSRVVRRGGLGGETIGIAGLETAFMDVLVRVKPLSGRVQVERLTEGRSSFVVEVRASKWTTARTYAVLGVEHILLGVDHLLFVLGLLLIVPRRWMLFKTITAFTVAHSATLAIATLGFAQVPSEPLNVCIALSILFLGPEILRFRRGETSLTLRYPWVVAFVFGLLHGFGFASGLNALGMPAAEIPLALLSFNGGVEIGQLGFVGLVLALVRSWQILQVSWPRAAGAIPAVAIGSLGAYWFVQRMFIMMNGWREL